MCVIIYAKAGKEIPKKNLEQAFKSNPDGAGFMVQKDKEMPYFEKGFFTFDSFYKAYKSFADKGCYDIAVHMRIKTHGNIDLNNCHPFALRNSPKDVSFTEGFCESLYMHNGTIQSIDVPRNGEHSDTFEFAFRVMSSLNPLGNMAIRTILSNIETASRFCIMREGHAPLLVGSFVEDDGIMYSNTSYKKVSYFTNPYNYTYLAQFENLSDTEFSDVIESLEQDGSDVLDCYEVGSFRYVELAEKPKKDTILGKKYRCYA